MAHRTGTKLTDDGGTVIEVRIIVNGKVKFLKAGAISGRIGQAYRLKLNDGNEVIYSPDQDIIEVGRRMLVR